jgi:2-methylisocitrate lyase-like PEP mutase family enzyme
VGVDGVFIAGIKSAEHYERVGKTLKGAFLSAAMFEGGDTPWLTPAVLGEMGYSQVSFPAWLLFRVAAAMEGALAQLRRHAAGKVDPMPPENLSAVRAVLDESLQLARWRRIEADFGLPEAGRTQQGDGR